MPFFYGWVIVACAGCASVARQGAAVATLSVFVAPMITEFDWSSASLSGAVSLGGVLGALSAPLLGRFADRSGARVMLSISAIIVGVAVMSIANTTSLLGFYAAFSIARMMFAGPFDIGITTAIANWFVNARGRAMAVVGVLSGLGLACMPLLAQVAIDARGWRFGWIVIGSIVLIVGAVPVAVLMRRRPEDMGLVPDGADHHATATDQVTGQSKSSRRVAQEPIFTRQEALATRAAWMLMGYTAVLFCVQAGMSLHQAPFLIERGIDPLVAASIVASFPVASSLSAIVYGYLADRWPIRFSLVLSGVISAMAINAMQDVQSAADGYVSAILFGLGIGGLMTLGPVAWANYFGRRNFGAIRGITLPVQVLGQASGPLLVGLLHDRFASYDIALEVLFVLAVIATLFAALASRPNTPSARTSFNR